MPHSSTREHWWGASCATKAPSRLPTLDTQIGEDPKQVGNGFRLAGGSLDVSTWGGRGNLGITYTSHTPRYFISGAPHHPIAVKFLQHVGGIYTFQFPHKCPRAHTRVRLRARYTARAHRIMFGPYKFWKFQNFSNFHFWSLSLCPVSLLRSPITFPCLWPHAWPRACVVACVPCAMRPIQNIWEKGISCHSDMLSL